MQNPGASGAAGIRFAIFGDVLPVKLSRNAAVATLLLKHRPDLITVSDTVTTGTATVEETLEAERLAKDLEKLGPTFVKLGQLLSTRADLLPPAYLEALSRLQDDVEPVAPRADPENDRRRSQRANVERLPELR